MSWKFFFSILLFISIQSIFPVFAQQMDSMMSKNMFPPILEGKLDGKFIHQWSVRGGDHGSTSTSAFVVDRDNIYLPNGNWMIFVSSHINHMNGQFQMQLECDGEFSEPVYLNGRGTNNQWETITIANCFSGIKVHDNKPVQIVIRMNRGGSSSSATLGDIAHYITAFKIKKIHKTAAR